MSRSTVVVAGASGFLGSALRGRLTAAGHDVRQLVRHQPAGPDQVRWDPAQPLDPDPCPLRDRVGPPPERVEHEVGIRDRERWIEIGGAGTGLRVGRGEGQVELGMAGYQPQKLGAGVSRRADDAGGDHDA